MPSSWLSSPTAEAGRSEAIMARNHQTSAGAHHIYCTTDTACLANHKKTAVCVAWQEREGTLMFVGQSICGLFYEFAVYSCSAGGLWPIFSAVCS
jgi:hypothetical protein